MAGTSVQIKGDIRELGLAAEGLTGAAGNLKSVAVPEGQWWGVLSAFATLVTSAEVGERRLAWQASADSLVVSRTPAGATQAASLTRSYTFAPGLADQTEFRDGDLTTPAPLLWLGPGDVLQVSDAADVDDSGDALTASVMVVKRTGEQG